MSEIKHTPLPWTLFLDAKNCLLMSSEDYLASFYECNEDTGQDIPAVENVKFILLACNAHDALVDALQDILDAHCDTERDFCGWCDRRTEPGELCTSDDCLGVKARAALAKARGETKAQAGTEAVP